MRPEGLTNIELIVYSSLHLIMHDANLQPCAYGSGCIVMYKGKKFLLSVAHVTDIPELSVCIETGLPPIDGKTPQYCVGAMRYFDMYKINPENLILIASADDLLMDEHFDETLDVTFCEIKEDVALLQQEIDTDKLKIKAGPKALLALDLAGSPTKKKEFGFCGRVYQQLVGNVLHSANKIALGLKFIKTIGHNHIFTVPNVITDINDYKGCSGAPILDEDGMLVGLAVEARENSKILRAFSIEKCRRLLDTAIEAGMFN